MRALLILLIIATVAIASRYHLRWYYWNAPFLKDISGQGKVEYRSIVADKKLTSVQEQKQMEEWAKKYHRAKELKKFNDKMDENMKRLKSDIPKLLASLPAAFNEYMKITENKDKTMSEIKQELRKMREKNPDVYSLLRHAIWHYKKRHMPVRRLRSRRLRWLRARMIRFNTTNGKSKEKTILTQKFTKSSGSEVKKQ